MRRAKIVATIGPRTRSPEMLRKLIEAGMDVARFNFSHINGASQCAEFLESVAHLRRISQELNRPVAVLQDLQGVKIRTGTLVDGKPVTLKKGRPFTITTREIAGTETEVSTGYELLPYDVRAGNRILLSDGSIELEVREVSSRDIECVVISGGKLREKQGINAPETNISAPPLTEKDKKDALFGSENDVDYMALSFVRRAEDIVELRRLLGRMSTQIHLIAKLEKPTALVNLEDILDVCDGVMVARGDLGVEMAPERVPLLQKRIIRAANDKGKPVITATQMLESMIASPRPTRAEASDVANAVLDGSDAVMLSAETATGDYPIEAVSMMSKIVQEAETIVESPPHKMSELRLSYPDAICEAAHHASQSIHARYICAFTQTGSTARTIAKYRPLTEILGMSPDLRIIRRMCLYWGVRPLQFREIHNVDELIQTLEKSLLKSGQARNGDNLVILTGAPIIEKGHTSLMKLHRVTEKPSPQMSIFEDD